VRDLALNTSGDLDLVSRRLRLTEQGAEALAQKLRVRLGLAQGDWFMDRRVGVPYYTDVMGKQPAGAAEALLRGVIMTCPGVAALESFTLTRNTDRRARLSFAVRSTSGDIVTIDDFIASLSVPGVITSATTTGSA
jgi:hypothetical protein